jgi:hypothetical protein
LTDEGEAKRGEERRGEERREEKRREGKRAQRRGVFASMGSASKEGDGPAPPQDDASSAAVPSALERLFAQLGPPHSDKVSLPSPGFRAIVARLFSQNNAADPLMSSKCGIL